MPHLLYTPDNLQECKHWSLIVFLHGRGERGTDIERVKAWGLPKRLEQENNFPFIVLSPQCPETTYWDAQTEPVMTLIDQLISSHPVDSSRVFLTGFSMGGLGTWTIAMEHPERFRAIAPVAAVKPPNLDKVDVLKEMPVWAFHGDKDGAVPIGHTEEMVKILRDKGSEKVKFTVFEGEQHVEAADLAYDMDELYQWMLSQ